MSLVPGRCAALLCALLVTLAACAGPSPSPDPSTSGDPTPSASPSACRRSTHPSAASVGKRRRRHLRRGRWRHASSPSRGPGTRRSRSCRPGTPTRYPSLVTNPNTLEAGWILIVSGDPSATPAPTPAATPCPPDPAGGLGCRAGNRVAAGTPQTFYTIPSAGHGVALTFDMGGRLDPGVDILNLLIANRVCATSSRPAPWRRRRRGSEIMAIIRPIRSCSRSATTPCTTATWCTAASARRPPRPAPAVRRPPTSSAAS